MQMKQSHYTYDPCTVIKNYNSFICIKRAIKPGIYFGKYDDKQINKVHLIPLH